MVNCRLLNIARAVDLNGALLRDLSSPSSLKRWQNQRGSARWRGIAFEITFEQWEAWWAETGHFDERGKERGQWVMARKGDRGAYETGNVECIKAERNVSEGNSRRHLCGPSQ